MFTVILAGGASRRMGKDKAMLPYSGETMLQTLIDRYAAYGPVGVSVDRSERFPFHGAMELIDPFPGQGPLNGIISAFRAAEESSILLTAVDLPYGEMALAQKLDELRGDADACVVKTGPKGIEPLFAIYGRRCKAAAELCLSQQRKSLLALLDRVDVRYVVPEELNEFDLERIFTNVNTPEDLFLLQNGDDG